MGKSKKLISSNFIIAGLMVTAYAVVMGLLHVYYYDLNDDVLMKDILAGVFTGTPDGHNIQMLYPVSLIISAFYRVIGSLSWYGFFLLVSQVWGMSVIIGMLPEIAAFISKRSGIAFAAIGLLAMSALMPGHFLIVQYTFTVAVLCGAAAVLLALLILSCIRI